MKSLRDAVRKSSPGRPQFRRILQAMESNLGLESAEDMSDAEVLDLMEEVMDLVPDFKGQLELHREIPKSARSHNLILDIILRKLIDQDSRGFSGRRRFTGNFEQRSHRRAWPAKQKSQL